MRFLCIILLLGYCLSCPAQETRTKVTDTTLAYRITQKLGDSLSLTPEQRRRALIINQWVDSNKRAVIHVFHGRDSLNILMKKLERKRDSLYQGILTDKQFVQYGTYKSTMVLNN